MTNYFINRLNRDNGKQINKISDEVQKRFASYDWPGNIRELENIIERAVILCRSDQITLDDLPENIFYPVNIHLSENSRGLEEQVEMLEKEMIFADLRRSGGNQSKAARNLKITERKIRYKIQKYKLD